MNVKKTRVSLLVAILTVALMFSLFAVSAFAESSSEDAAVSSPAGDVSSPAEESSSSAAEESTPAAGTSSTTKPAATTKAPASSSTGSGEEGDSMTDTIISIVVGAVIIIAVAVVCIIKREPLGKFMRSLKSEMGKIVWLPKNQTLKNTVVVLIIVAACAIAIGIIDLAFGSGITLLGQLFR